MTRRHDKQTIPTATWPGFSYYQVLPSHSYTHAHIVSVGMVCLHASCKLSCYSASHIFFIHKSNMIRIYNEGNIAGKGWRAPSSRRKEARRHLPPYGLTIAPSPARLVELVSLDICFCHYGSSAQYEQQDGYTCVTCETKK